MQNEIATKTQNQIANYDPSQEQSSLSSDLIVPYLTIAQGMSESVKERKAQMGDIVRSTNFEKLGDPDKPVEIIILGKPKEDWIIEQKVGNRFEYRRTEPRTAKTERLDWNFWADAEGNELPQGAPGALEWRRVKRLLVFALLPHDIAANEAEIAKLERGELPDPSKALTPIAISFRSTSYNAGKEVVTFFEKAKTVRTPVWRYKLKFSCYLDKNDQGSFYVAKVDTNAPQAVPKEQLELVGQWAAVLGTFKTDDSQESSLYTENQAVSTEPSANAKDVC